MTSCHSAPPAKIQAKKAFLFLKFAMLAPFRPAPGRMPCMSAGAVSAPSWSVKAKSASPLQRIGPSSLQVRPRPESGTHGGTEEKIGRELAIASDRRRGAV